MHLPLAPALDVVLEAVCALGHPFPSLQQVVHRAQLFELRLVILVQQDDCHPKMVRSELPKACRCSVPWLSAVCDSIPVNPISSQFWIEFLAADRALFELVKCLLDFILVFIILSEAACKRELFR